MRKLLLIALTLGMFQNGFSQFAFNNVPFKLKNSPNGSYKIIQSRNGEVTKIEEVNENGDVIFQYIQGDIPPFFNWTEPHRFIYAFEFNSKGDKVKRYAFNSNAGHIIYEYDYDRSRKTTYERNYPESEDVRNTNAYANISRITNFKELVSSSEVLRMNNSEKAFLEVEYLNESGQPTKTKKYSSMYQDSMATLFDYDSENRVVRKRVVTSSGEIKKEVKTEYPNDKTKITTILNYHDGQIMTTHKFANVKDSLTETEIKYSVSGKQLNVRIYTYENGYNTNIEVYNTKYKNKLIVPISKKFKKTSAIKYTYNSDGLLQKEEMSNYKTGKKETRIYTYVIER